MKTEIIECEPVFKPIKIVLTIESWDELIFLHHLSNMSINEVRQSMCTEIGDFDTEKVKDCIFILYKTLDKALKMKASMEL